MLFTIIVSGSLLFFLPQFTYNEIAIFAVAITIMSSLSASLLQGDKYMYAAIASFSILGTSAISFFEILNAALIPTQLLLSQLIVNIFVIILLSISQKIFPLQGMRT